MPDNAKRLVNYLLLALTTPLGCGAQLTIATASSPKPHKLTFSIVGVTAKIPKSSFSTNRDVFVARLIGTKTGYDWAKIEYRYLGYEQDFPDELLSPNMRHTFLAVRDRSCDESLNSLRTKVVVDADGKSSPVDILRYSTNGASLDLPGEQQLPCFVVQPRSYRGSRLTKPPIVPTQIARK